MYCKHCGSFVDDNLPYCKNCGAQIEGKHVHHDYADYDFDDDSSFWIAFLGFAIPIVGLILFLIYEGKKPKRAKSAVKGSLAGLIFRVFFP